MDSNGYYYKEWGKYPPPYRVWLKYNKYEIDKEHLLYFKIFGIEITVLLPKRKPKYREYYQHFLYKEYKYTQDPYEQKDGAYIEGFSPSQVQSRFNRRNKTEKSYKEVIGEIEVKN